MKKLITILLAIFAFASSAFAGVEVNVKADLSHVTMIVGGRVLVDTAMVNGVATGVGNLDSALVGKGEFCGFVTHEKMADIRRISHLSFRLQKSLDQGVGLFNTGGIYSLTITKDGRREVIPVTFGPLGVGVKARDGGRLNLGYILVSDKESDWSDWESIPEPQPGEEQPPLITPTEGGMIN